MMASEFMSRNPAIDEFVIRGLDCRMSPLATYWPFEVLQRKPGVYDDVVEVSSQIVQNAKRKQLLTIP